MEQSQVRETAVAETIAKVRQIESEQGVTREALAEIRAELLRLAARRELFPPEDFPGPADGKDNRLYTLSMDPDKRFALYLNRGSAEKDTPPHNHTTWAVVVGIAGEELNKIYRTVDAEEGGPARLEVAETIVVQPGAGVCLLPDDIHSIHMRGEDVKLHLHMYGKAISEMTERVKYDPETGRSEHFPPHRDAR